MKPILIIPDIHNHVADAEHLVTQFPDHDVVFLGDYFDDYDDSPSDARKTAEWLEHSLRHPNRTHLMGNHDAPYRWGESRAYCPGWTKEKNSAVNRVLDPPDWNRIPMFKVVDRPDHRPLLLSHAGFNLANLYCAPASFDVTYKGRLAFVQQFSPESNLQQLEREAEDFRAHLNHGGGHPWLNQGMRMGHRNVAGPLWLDIGDNHTCLPGIDQIVGHSHVHTPEKRSYPNYSQSEADTWFIDGGGKFAVIVNETGDIVPIHTSPDRVGEPVFPTNPNQSL